MDITKAFAKVDYSTIIFKLSHTAKYWKSNSIEIKPEKILKTILCLKFINIIPFKYLPQTSQLVKSIISNAIVVENAVFTNF